MFRYTLHFVSSALDSFHSCCLLQLGSLIFFRQQNIVPSIFNTFWNTTNLPMHISPILLKFGIQGSLYWSLDSANHFQDPVLYAGMDLARVLPAPLPLIPPSPPWDYKSTPETHTSDHDLAAYKQRDFSCLFLYLVCNPCPSSRAKW